MTIDLDQLASHVRAAVPAQIHHCQAITNQRKRCQRIAVATLFTNGDIVSVCPTHARIVKQGKDLTYTPAWLDAQTDTGAADGS